MVMGYWTWLKFAHACWQNHIITMRVDHICQWSHPFRFPRARWSSILTFSPKEATWFLLSNCGILLTFVIDNGCISSSRKAHLLCISLIAYVNLLLLKLRKEMLSVPSPQTKEHFSLRKGEESWQFAGVWIFRSSFVMSSNSLPMLSQPHKVKRFRGSYEALCNKLFVMGRKY